MKLVVVNMKRINYSRIILFAFPCYWTLAVIFIALFFWKVGLNEPDLIPLGCVSIAIIIAAILLENKHYWICIPMIALGLYIASLEDQHVGHIFQLFGSYLVLHYIMCGVYKYRKRGEE